jgi:hypothetical protein
MRTEEVYKEIGEAKCAAFSVLMERLRATHNELFYVLRKLRQEGRVVAVNLGRAAFWCASRAAAEEVLSRLTETLKSLLCGRRRFATPKEALRLVVENEEARKLFSRHMLLRPNPATAQIIDALMARAFGDPIKTSRGHIYYIRCAPAEKCLQGSLDRNDNDPCKGPRRRGNSIIKSPSEELW